MSETLPRLAASGVMEAVRELRREPFQEILGDFIQNAPDGPSIRQFAKKAPDRWMQAVTMGSKLAGYNEKIEVAGTIHHVHQLSDQELERRLRELNSLQAEIIVEPANPVKLLASGT